MTQLSDHRKADAILAHMRRVEDNLVRCAKELLATDKQLALELLKRSRSHDLSKFDELEFDHLWTGDPRFDEAKRRHHSLNAHHPEHKRVTTGPGGLVTDAGVDLMSEADLAEMACDWAARGQEFGTNVRAWAFGDAATKHGFTKDDRVGKSIDRYLKMALAEPFAYETVTRDPVDDELRPKLAAIAAIDGLPKWDALHNLVVELYESKDSVWIDRLMALCLETRNRGFVRSVLMSVKPIKDRADLSSRFEELANWLKAGNESREK